MSQLRDVADAVSVAVFLFSKAGTVLRVAHSHLVSATSESPDEADEEYSRDEATVQTALGIGDPSGRGSSVLWNVAALPDSYVSRFGVNVAALDLPLNGPNRTFGFVRLTMTAPAAARAAQDAELKLRVDQVALMISAVRRRTELDCLNVIREFLSRSVLPLDDLFHAVTGMIVAPWTEYSVALIRAVAADGTLGLRSSACAADISCPPGDFEPRAPRDGLLGEVVSSGEPTFIANIDSERARFRDIEWLDLLGLKAFACLPIRRGTHIAGTLSIFVRFPYRFYPSKQQFMQSLCEHLGTSLAIDRLRRSQEQTRAFTKELLDPGSAVQDILQHAVDGARELLDADFGYIAIASKNDERLHPIAWTHRLSADVIPTLALKGDGLTPLVFNTGTPINEGDVRAGPRATQFVDLQGPLSGQVVSELVVPMVYEGQTVGVVDIESTTAFHFTLEDQAVLEMIANQAALVHHKHRLYRAVERLATLRFEVKDRDGLYRTIVDAAADIADVENVVLCLVDEPASNLTLVHSRRSPGISWPNAASISLPVPRGPLARVLADGTAVIVDDLEALAQSVTWLSSRKRLATALLLPLVADASTDEGRRAMGVIFLFTVRHCRFSESERSVLTALSNAAGLALKDARNREALEAAYDRAVRNATLLSVAEIAAGVAHDVRNVLNQATTAKLVVAAQVSRALDGDRRDRAEAELQKMDTAFEQLTFYFDRLRHYARFAKPRFGATDVNTVLNTVLDLLDYRIARNSVKVKRDLRLLPQVRGDEDQLVRAFTNVMANALDAVKQRGGLIIVATDLVQSDKYIRVRITDDGTGFDDEIRAKVFEPYFTTKPQGTGMGLPIVRQIIEQVHGGSVEVESKRGRGTTFSLMLPNVPADDEEE